MNRSIAISVDNASVFMHKNNSLFSRKSTEILKDVSLKVYEGETLGVVGANGAGKSTLLSLLAGVITPDVGNVNRYSNKVALLNLNLGFDLRLSGYRNAMLQGLLLGFDYKDIKSKLGDIINFSGLGKAIDNPLYTYSSGMRARLGFSVAYFMEADVLLIDEMLGVGDAEFRKKTTYLIKQKVKSNQTVVLVTHNTNLMTHLAERVITIENGVITENSDPSQKNT